MALNGTSVVVKKRRSMVKSPTGEWMPNIWGAEEISLVSTRDSNDPSCSGWQYFKGSTDFQAHEMKKLIVLKWRWHTREVNPSNATIHDIRTLPQTCIKKPLGEASLTQIKNFIPLFKTLIHKDKR